ncbi:MAG: putative nucleotidyltransferase [Gemmatimonadetes bacterium]|nr:putative nucleotidyltransferase [Gemmatimonadota bacterium]
MIDVVAECLSLRRWAIAVLAHSSPTRPFPEVSVPSWRFFLATESCARHLVARLGSMAPTLPPAARAVLQTAARDETQRVMAARAQLMAMDGLAERLGLEPVVLKGGMHAIDGGDVFDLCDVDLLLPRDDIPPFTHAMQQAGYRFNPSLEQLSMAGGVIVEPHYDLEVGYGVEVIGNGESVRMPVCRRLRRLAPAAHLAFCVQHTTTKHPLRRGHLRDVLLIADAMNDCSPAELADVRLALGHTTGAEVYLSTLDFADSIRSHAPVHDPFVRVAAAKYATADWFPNGPTSDYPLQFDHVLQFVAPAAEWWRLVKGYLTTNRAPTSRGYSRTVARYSRPLAAGVAVMARTPYRLVALGNAFAVAMAIRICYALHWRQQQAGHVTHQ